MLEEPEVKRAVMGWLGPGGAVLGNVLAHSTALWALALDGATVLSPTGANKHCGIYRGSSLSPSAITVALVDWRTA